MLSDGGGSSTASAEAGARAASSQAAAAAAAASAAGAEASVTSSSAASTLDSLSDLYIRALYVCRVGSQTVFALSPIAAYLPQYLAMQADASHGSHGSHGHGHGHASGSSSSSDLRGREFENAAASPTGASSNGSGGCSMHRRTRSRSPIGLGKAAASSPQKSLANAPSSNAAASAPPSSGNSTYSNGGGGSGAQPFFSPPDATIGRSSSSASSRQQDGKSDGGGGSGGGGGGGMSPISMLILLLSHLLRLLYFYGHHVWLPSSSLQKIPSTIGGRDYGDEEIQYDLVVQSLVMIGVQLLLVRVTARTRLAKAKRRLSDHDHSDATQLGCARVGGFVSSSNKRHGRLGRFWLDSVFAAVKCLVARLMYVLHPQRIWRYNTLREHVEFLCIFMVLTCAYCRISLFPTLGGDGVDRVRNVSVLLESCLALPQVVQNYVRRDTAGLSLVMIVGWIMGDWMKLLYFLLQSPDGGDTASDAAVAAVGGPVAHTAAAAVAGAAVPGAEVSSGATLRVFAGGCIVALTLDVWVLLQLVLWYPTRQMMTMRAKVGETWDRFKPNDAAGRKRAVAKEMIRALFRSTDGSNRQTPPRRKNTDELRTIPVADGSSNWS